MLERVFQADLIKKLRQMFPDCIVLKNDAEYMQGVPDLLILWKNKWAMLEVKRRRPRSSADFEPNQEWYLEKMDQMSFAACIYPENEEEVLSALQRSFRSTRSTRLPQRI